MRSSINILAGIVVFAAVVFAACDATAPDDSGSITVLIKDEPFPFDLVDSVMVTINSVELVGEDSTENVVVLSDIAQSFNLLELRNGVTDTLANLALPTGAYSSLRVIVDEDAYVVLKDGRTFDLKTPSGTTSGIKVKFPTVEVDESTDDVEVLVDFDVEKSFVLQGNANTPAGIKGFLFKPVIRVENLELNDVSLLSAG